jgi:hypothetical protein
MSTMPVVDWSVFDQYPENTCYCRCEFVYRSHTKIVNHEGKLVQVSRKPCPDCGKSVSNTKRVSSDPERMILK